MALTLETLTDPADVRLAAVTRIYTKAFPPGERKPASCFAEMIPRPDYAVIVAMIAETVAGFAVVFVPEKTTDAALLEYIAVNPAASGQGIGTALVRQAMQLADDRPLLMEVESARDEQSDRRRFFYRRIGCERIEGLCYLLPLPDAPPMDLFINKSARIAKQQLRRWLSVIYSQVYGCKSEDQRLGRMMEMLPEEIRLD